MKTVNRFEHTLPELYTFIDGQVRLYLSGTLDEVEKEFVLSDIIKVSEKLVAYNCKKYIKKFNALELAFEDAYSLAIGSALIEALNRYDDSKGIYFLKYWEIQIMGAICNEHKRLNTKRQKLLVSLYSIENNSNSKEDYKINYLDKVAAKRDLASEVCLALSLQALIDEFEKKDNYGKLIACEFHKTNDQRITEVLKVLKANQYGARERKIVQRTKERFAKFLLENDFCV